MTIPKAPPLSSFPSHPASWYFFCHKKELEKGPLARRLLGRDLVAFQTKSGKVAVLDARCSHLGANLGAWQIVVGGNDPMSFSWIGDTEATAVL